MFKSFFIRWLLIFHGKIKAASILIFLLSSIILIPDLGVYLFILYLELSNINLISLSVN